MSKYLIMALIYITGFILVSLRAFAIPTSQKMQLVCKEKAKESARTAYTSCITDAKEAEIEKVRSDYKAKLDQLKSYYDKKIKSLSPEGQDSQKPEVQEAKEIKEVSSDDNIQEAPTAKTLQKKGRSNKKARQASNKLPRKKMKSLETTPNRPRPDSSRDGVQVTEINSLEPSSATTSAANRTEPRDPNIGTYSADTSEGTPPPEITTTPNEGGSSEDTSNF